VWWLCGSAKAGPDALTEEFLTIATGVPLLERRTDGRAPLTETIILSVD